MRHNNVAFYFLPSSINIMRTALLPQLYKKYGLLISCTITFKNSFLSIDDKKLNSFIRFSSIANYYYMRNLLRSKRIGV